MRAAPRPPDAIGGILDGQPDSLHAALHTTDGRNSFESLRLTDLVHSFKPTRQIFFPNLRHSKRSRSLSGDCSSAIKEIARLRICPRRGRDVVGKEGQCQCSVGWIEIPKELRFRFLGHLGNIFWRNRFLLQKGAGLLKDSSHLSSHVFHTVHSQER